MIYDLENPLSFFQSIADILDENGIWHFEQSYLPSMLETNAYDTICHEHLEYYTLGNIKYMLEQANLKIIDVQINDINGGSFAVTAAHMHSNIFSPNKATIDSILEKEQEMGLSTLNPFREFERRVFEHRNNLRKLVSSLVSDGKKVFGYGASTKGNVILQFCGFTSKQIPFIVEVNEDKFGHYTPGTNIPIISEIEANKMCPDYYLVLPWHFRNSILEREVDFINKGGKFIFPLPSIEII